MSPENSQRENIISTYDLPTLDFGALDVTTPSADSIAHLPSTTGASSVSALGDHTYTTSFGIDSDACSSAAFRMSAETTISTKN